MAKRGAAQLQQRMRLGADHVDPVAGRVAHPNGAGLGAVVAVEQAHQRRFAGAGDAGQRDAFAGAHPQLDAADHRDAHAALGVQRECLGEILDDHAVVQGDVARQRRRRFLGKRVGEGDGVHRRHGGPQA